MPLPAPLQRHKGVIIMKCIVGGGSLMTSRWLNVAGNSFFGYRGVVKGQPGQVCLDWPCPRHALALTNPLPAGEGQPRPASKQASQQLFQPCHAMQHASKCPRPYRPAAALGCHSHPPPPLRASGGGGGVPSSLFSPAGSARSLGCHGAQKSLCIPLNPGPPARPPLPQSPTCPLAKGKFKEGRFKGQAWQISGAEAVWGWKAIARPRQGGHSIQRRQQALARGGERGLLP